MERLLAARVFSSRKETGPRARPKTGQATSTPAAAGSCPSGWPRLSLPQSARGEQLRTGAAAKCPARDLHRRHRHHRLHHRGAYGPGKRPFARRPPSRQSTRQWGPWQLLLRAHLPPQDAPSPRRPLPCRIAQGVAFSRGRGEVPRHRRWRLRQKPVWKCLDSCSEFTALPAMVDLPPRVAFSWEVRGL